MEHYPMYELSAWNCKAKLPNCQIWESKLTHVVAQVYQIENFQLTHAKINRNTSHLVHSLGVVQDRRKNRTYLLIQRIPNRLSQVNSLNESQSLKVMHAVFKGLQQLSMISGLLGLTQNCICFNEEGQVKIWMNSDLSSLSPIFKQRESGNNSSRIISNIYQVVSIIQRKCFNSNFLKPFLRKLSENKVQTYNQAAQQIEKIGNQLFIVVAEKPNNPHTKTIKQITKNVDSENNRLRRRQLSNIQSPKLSTEKESHPQEHRRFRSYLDQKSQSESANESPDFFLNIRPYSYQNFEGHHFHLPIKTREHLQDASIKINLSPRLKLESSDSYEINQNSPRFSDNQNFNKKNSFEGYYSALYSERTEKTTNQVEKPTYFDDSFSNNFPNQCKQALVCGEFQTFGLLQDSTDQKQNSQTLKNKPESLKIRESLKCNKLESNMREEIQVNYKNHSPAFRDISSTELNFDGNMHKKMDTKCYLRTQRVQKSNLSSQHAYSKTQVELANLSRLKNFSDYFQEEMNRSNITTPRKEIRLQKSSGVTYIDKKYEQYIKNSNNKKQPKTNQYESLRSPPGKPLKHLKHYSNHEAKFHLLTNAPSIKLNSLSSNRNSTPTATPKPATVTGTEAIIGTVIGAGTGAGTGAKETVFSSGSWRGEDPNKVKVTEKLRVNSTFNLKRQSNELKPQRQYLEGDQGIKQKEGDYKFEFRNRIMTQR